MIRNFSLVLIGICIQSNLASAMQDPLSFDDALSQMIESNVTVRVQTTNELAADERLLAVKGRFLPQISATYSQQTGGGLPFEQSYAVNGQVNLFRWGSDLAKLRAARFDQQFENTTLEQAKLDAETQGSEALFDLNEQNQTLEIYLKSEANARFYLEIAQQRFDKSLLSRQELDKVAIDLSNAEAQRADTQTNLDHAKQVVESLLGHFQVVNSWPWNARLDSSQIARLLKEPDEESTFHERPDFRAAEDQVAAETSRATAAYRTILPSLDLNLSESQGYTEGQTTSSGFATSATLTLPLFNGLQDSTNYHIQEATRMAAEYRLSQLKRQIVSQIREARQVYQTALTQYRSRVKALAIAQRLLDADAARFKLGRADANDLNLDLDRVVKSQLLAIQGTHRVHSAYLALHHVYGLSVRH